MSKILTNKEKKVISATAFVAGFGVYASSIIRFQAKAYNATTLIAGAASLTLLIIGMTYFSTVWLALAGFLALVFSITTYINNWFNYKKAVMMEKNVYSYVEESLQGINPEEQAKIMLELGMITDPSKAAVTINQK